MNKKEYKKLFEPINNAGTQVWVKTGTKTLSEVIVEMTIALAGLETIKYIRVCEQSLTASSHNYPKRPKVPVVHSGAHHATGIELFYDLKLKSLTFNDINPEEDLLAEKMVCTVLDILPINWKPVLIMYSNEEFWNKMHERYSKHEWFIL